MPSESQYNQALRELADLERELELLKKACDPSESVNRIHMFIAHTEEGLTAPDNDTAKQGDKCGCKIL
eukprot:CAMPEP_0201581780 /NCGR_PEP_ID=MMETSP0190_2-20130828/75308_1 /ASSEMBLY_ACC=CAM_ASM_000263 /TAXON_ID=37353 /ORGANISM="Rosalina sp." /LENGTH=67 /DNA_ID=CAMNT_0048020447 /DNA_START=79 /DNA_END=282 /DNA_ORIENTATION=+